MIHMEDRITVNDILRIIWMGLKTAVVIYAVFQASNLTILYQGF